MAEKFIINATNSALAEGGETTAAWTCAESTGAPTDTEIGTILTTAANDAVAVMDTTPSAAEKAAVAWCLLESLVSGMDLDSPAKRKAFKLKAGLDELLDILATMGTADN